MIAFTIINNLIYNLINYQNILNIFFCFRNFRKKNIQKTRFIIYFQVLLVSGFVRYCWNTIMFN